MAQIIWYLKKEDNLVKYKNNLFRPADYINLNDFVETAIQESTTMQSLLTQVITSQRKKYTKIVQWLPYFILLTIHTQEII